jgi:hypothetical protein
LRQSAEPSLDTRGDLVGAIDKLDAIGRSERLTPGVIADLKTTLRRYFEFRTSGKSH